jgi:hypothetical protein
MKTRNVKTIQNRIRRCQFLIKRLRADYNAAVMAEKHRRLKFSGITTTNQADNKAVHKGGANGN